VLLLPQVLAGRISLVGLPLGESAGLSVSGLRQGSWPTEIELGPKGLTGLVQINHRDDLTPEETERYAVYYAKNQSVVLDLEILSKAIALHLKKERRMRDGEGSS
jgi:lipopolysaccharide/colanic/teichoic acid biosynthesis glycosyltransferase